MSFSEEVTEIEGTLKKMKQISKFVQTLSKSHSICCLPHLQCNTEGQQRKDKTHVYTYIYINNKIQYMFQEINHILKK